MDWDELLWGRGAEGRDGAGGWGGGGVMGNTIKNWLMLFVIVCDLDLLRWVNEQKNIHEHITLKVMIQKLWG